MALLNIQGNTVTLANGIALPQVQEQSVLFVTRLKEVAKLGDEITIAHVLLLQQGGWMPATKANFQGLEDWANTLYQGNKTLFSRFKSWAKVTLGLEVEIRDKDDGTYGVIKPIGDADAMALYSSLGEALAKGASEGILMQDKPKKAPKASAGRGGSKNSNVLGVSKSQAVSEKIGIAQALADASDEEVQALGEIGELIAQIIEHGKKNRNRKQLLDVLTATVDKLNKGFNLSAAMKKVASEAA